MKVADYLVRALAACGVRHIFGYPGAPLVPLLAALQRQTVVEWVLMRHENAAAHAAAAQAKLTGQLAVCVATSGPGALQAVCGIVDAQLDRAPLLALTALSSRATSSGTGTSKTWTRRASTMPSFRRASPAPRRRSSWHSCETSWATQRSSTRRYTLLCRSMS